MRHRRIATSSRARPRARRSSSSDRPVSKRRENMNTATTAAPAYIANRGSIKVEQLTCAIGAELGNVNLGVASRDAGLVAEIRALLLKYRVVFFRDQEITRAEHVAFARHFGDLED